MFWNIKQNRDTGGTLHLMSGNIVNVRYNHRAMHQSQHQHNILGSSNFFEFNVFTIGKDNKDKDDKDIIHSKAFAAL